MDSQGFRSSRGFASCMFEHRVQGSTGSLDLVCLLLEAAHAAPVNGHGWFKADRRRPPGWTTPGGVDRASSLRLPSFLWFIALFSSIRKRPRRWTLCLCVLSSPRSSSTLTSLACNISSCIRLSLEKLIQEQGGERFWNDLKYS